MSPPPTYGTNPAAPTQQMERMEALGQLAGGIAHDFNNVLAVISSYATFVTERAAQLGADDVVADVEQITRAVLRGAELTRRLLTFARREVVQPQVLSLNDSVTRVQELLGRTLGENIELSTALQVAVWPILADPGQIEQVLVNLAINARDAMPGGGALRIDTANVEVNAEDAVMEGFPAQPGPYVRLRVTDAGTGIPPDVLAHIFEPFFTTKSDGGGTGLGLATVYRIVQSCGASLSVRSQEGTGTSFTIMFPVTDQDPTPAEEFLVYERAPKGETVLVVEDEEPLREVTRRIFSRAGYQVLTAANGAEALKIAREHPGEIRLLVTDVVMPRMLGKEVAERVTAIRPDIGVLFMSGYARPVLASQGRLEPGVALVDKPFTAVTLLTKAALVLNGHFGGYQSTPTP